MIDVFTTIWLDGSYIERKGLVTVASNLNPDRAGKACVVYWYRDETVEGATSLQPLTCETVIDVLFDIIAKQSLGEELGAEEKDIVLGAAEEYVRAAQD